MISVIDSSFSEYQIPDLDFTLYVYFDYKISDFIEQKILSLRPHFHVFLGHFFTARAVFFFIGTQHTSNYTALFSLLGFSNESGPIRNQSVLWITKLAMYHIWLLDGCQSMHNDKRTILR
jgi:hypothetical protein